MDKEINKVKLYPNPFNRSFNIKLNQKISNNAKTEISVYNIFGELVHSGKIRNNQEYQFGSELKTGIYFVKVNRPNETVFVRVVKY